MKLLAGWLIVFLLTISCYGACYDWKVGDYWEYESTVGENITITKTKVVGIENITLYGKNYHVYRVITSINGQHFTGFYRVEDLADIGGYYNESNVTIICDPPMERFKFLEVGKKWNQSITWIENISGEFHNFSFRIYYECIGREKAKTRAGEFDCYLIKENSNTSTMYTVNYFSPTAKNIVLSFTYKGGQLQAKKELISTSYPPKKSPFIGFPIIILVFLMILLWHWRNYEFLGKIK